jgi:myo-inositol-1(or 4)-monophosphatase
MNNSLKRVAEIAASAARVAQYRHPELIESKGRHDFVTDIDRKLQADIARDLSLSFPGTPVFGEEDLTPDVRLPDDAFLIDPLDGTSNFIAGVPFSCVSVARIVDGATTLAVVVDIGTGCVYAAACGQGAWRNELPLRTPPPRFGLIALSSGVIDASPDLDTLRRLRQFGKIRNFGAQALQLCFVAQGSLLLCASVEARLWDDAAGRLIAREAGAYYQASCESDPLQPTGLQGSLCAHPGIFAEAAEILRPLLRLA